MDLCMCILCKSSRWFVSFGILRLWATETVPSITTNMKGSHLIKPVMVSRTSWLWCLLYLNELLECWNPFRFHLANFRNIWVELPDTFAKLDNKLDITPIFHFFSAQFITIYWFSEHPSFICGNSKNKSVEKFHSL